MLHGTWKRVALLLLLAVGAALPVQAQLSGYSVQMDMMGNPLQ
jgi:hypothetical protein